MLTVNLKPNIVTHQLLEGYQNKNKKKQDFNDLGQKNFNMSNRHAFTGLLQ